MAHLEGQWLSTRRIRGKEVHNRAAALGRGTRTGNSIEFRFDYPEGPSFNTFVWLPESDQWLFRMESQAADGKRQAFATDTLVRQR
ncbi:MAG TPA: hypothetical protein VMN79_11975 [Casimicrobiaceae bacterium]|nr:hypothetical protein [Casimicrobiaceae bacterium]